MANRYWVGGTGTWNTSSTTNWSASSGGASGASVPTVADAVFFDQVGTYTVTLTGALNCLDITVSAGTVTFSSTGTLAIRGSMSLLAGTVWSATGAITFSAITTGKTVTTNGVSLSAAITFNGVGGGWTLGSALTTTGAVTFTNGAFDTGNFACTNTSWASNNSNTRSISLGSSTITLSSATVPWTFTTTTGLTFNAGTSTINCSGSGLTFAGGGLTYNAVGFTSTAASSSVAITVPNTFANINISAPATGLKFISLSGNQTVTGTFTANGGTYNARTFVTSDVLGTARTITAATVAIAYCDFKDITGAGTGIWAGTSIGNCFGNSGITFDTAKTVYWNLAGAQNWSATGWAATSGGIPAAINFPLAQDTAVFDNTGSVTGTITVNAAWNIGTLDMSARTSAMTLATSTNTPTIYGSWKNGTGTTLSGTAVITFSGRTTQQITNAGKTFTQPITIDSPSGSVTLQDAIIVLSTGIVVTNGTFNANNFNVTAIKFISSTLVSNGLVLGNGTWTISTSGAAWTVANPPNVTDISSSAISMSTVGSPGYSSSTPVGSGGSIYCPAVADGATGLNSNDLSASDWTFEAWINVSAFTAGAIGGQLIITKIVPVTISNQGELTFSLGTSGKLVVVVRPTTNASISTYSSTGLVSLNTWTHVAVCMVNSTSTLKMFIGGVLDTTITSATKGGGTTTTRYGIGQYGNGFQPFAFSGLITQARVSNTARYSATFTPSTSPFTSDANTLLLVNQADRGVVASGSTGTITLTSATAKTFAGGSVQAYPTLNQGGAGALTMTGSNTFSNITNTYNATGATSILFTAVTTNTFTNWNASGAAGNLLSISSVTAATHTLSKATGTVTANYLSLTNSIATGGATWNAVNSTDNGGNTGWNFGNAFPGNFFFMFN